jgi:hypothetical protein
MNSTRAWGFVIEATILSTGGHYRDEEIHHLS